MKNGLVFALTLLCCVGSFFAATGQQNSSCMVIGNTLVCPNGTETYLLDYALPPGATVTWQVSGGTILEESEEEVTILWGSFTNSDNGIVNAIVRAANGSELASCKLSIKSNLPPRTIPISLKDEPQFHCLGTTYTFEPETQLTLMDFQWTVSGVDAQYTAIEDQLTIVFTTVGSLTISVSAIDAQGCIVQTSTVVNVIAPIVPSFIPLAHEVVNNSIDICRGQEVFFQNTSVGGIESALWEWSVLINGQVQKFYGMEDFSYRFITPGNYTVSLSYTPLGLTIECPISTFSINVNVSNDDFLEIICPSVVCAGTVAVYSTPANCSTYTWEVSPEGTIISQQGNTISVRWNSGAGMFSTGYVSLQATGCTQTNCSSPTVVEVPIFPTAAEIIGGDVACNTSASFRLPSWAGARYEWSFDVLDVYNGNSSSVSVQNPSNNLPNNFRLAFSDFSGKIKITAKVSHPIAGCEFVAEKIITVLGYTVDGPNNICSGSPIEFNATATPVGATVSWTITSGGQEIASYPNVGPVLTLGAGLPAGSYRALASVTLNGATCSKSKSFNVVEARPVEMIDGALSVCSNTNYTYFVVPEPLPGEEVEWTIRQGNTNPTTTTTTGPITVSWNNMNQGAPFRLSARRVITVDGMKCYSPLSSIDISIFENQPFSIMGDQTPCFDGTAVYTTSFSGALQYTWSINPALGVIVEGQGTPTATIRWYYTLQPQQATVMVSAISNCGSPLNAQLAVTLAPYNLVLDGPEQACTGTAVAFTSNAGVASDYNWFVDDILQPLLNGPQVNITFASPGQHRVRLDVVNPNGCSGDYSAVQSIYADPNPRPSISPIDPLPCPEGSSFSRILTALPNGPYTYTWYRNGQLLATSSTHTLAISATGVYTVAIDYGLCENISPPFPINYACGCNCDLPSANPITVRSVNALPGTECGTINFSGGITPSYSVSVNPLWQLTGAGGETSTIFITDPNQLNLLDIPTPSIGPIRIDLSAGELCGDGVTVCREGTYTFITIPFAADFDQTFACNQQNGNFAVTLQDRSAYHEWPGAVNKLWRVNGFNQGSGASATFSATPGEVLNVCLRLQSAASSYDCEVCREVQAPDAPTASFEIDQEVVCVGEMVHFTPMLGDEQIIDYEWNFGDNTLSRLAEPMKTYASAGTYNVSLTITTDYGCEFTYTQPITVSANNLSGVISETPMGCGTSVNLAFVPAPNGSTPVSYTWLPGEETTPTLVAGSSGVYGLEVRDAQGCSYQLMPVVVGVNTLFPAGITGDLENCGSVSLSVTAVQGYTYQWIRGSTGSGPITTTGTNLTISSPGEYTIHVQALQGGTVCQELGPVTVKVFPNPAAPQITETVLSCDPYLVQLTSNITGVYWRIPGFNTTNIYSDFLTVSTSGTYTATIIDENGCSATSSKTIATVVDFSSFLSGCYSFCPSDLNGISLQGIPGSFDAWEWRRFAPGASSFTVLSQGTGSIASLNLTVNMEGDIYLYVRSGNCERLSDPFCLDILSCCENVPNVQGARNLQCLISDGYDDYVYWVYGTFQIPSGYTLCGGAPSTSLGSFTYYSFIQNPIAPTLYPYSGWLRIPAEDYEEFMLNGANFIFQLCQGDLVCTKMLSIPATMCMLAGNCGGVTATIKNNPYTNVKTIELYASLSFVEGPLCDITSYTVDIINTTGGANTLLHQVVVTQGSQLDVRRFISYTLPSGVTSLQIVITSNCGERCIFNVSIGDFGGGSGFGLSNTCDEVQNGETIYDVSISIPQSISFDAYESSADDGVLDLERSGQTLMGKYKTYSPGAGFKGSVKVWSGSLGLEQIFNETLPNCMGLLQQSPQSEMGTSQPGLLLFPNPANEIVSVKYEMDQSTSELANLQLVIRNAIGVKVSTYAVNEQDMLLGRQIDCSFFPSGLYIISLENKGAVLASKRLIISKP